MINEVLEAVENAGDALTAENWDRFSDQIALATDRTEKANQLLLAAKTSL
jgi:hypothetical protein